MDQENMTLLQRLGNEYKRSEESLNGLSGSKFHEIRRKAMDIFSQTGFPTTRHEEWKYTNIFSILHNGFKFSGISSISKETLQTLVIPNLDCTKLVLVNGVYSAALSDILPDDVTVQSIRELFRIKSDRVENTYAEIADSVKNPFVALNTALAEDGLYIHLKKNCKVEKPIHIIAISDAQEDSVVSVPRLFIDVEKNAELTIVYTSHTIGNNSSWKNSVLEVIVQENASLTIINCQTDTSQASVIETIQSTIAEDAHYSLTTVSLGCNFIRNDANVILNGKNSEAHLYGLILGDGKRLIDNHTIVDHAKPHCESSEFYKYILDDKSTGIFNGKVFVREDAQKTNAYQSNKTILLSDTATINTKPQLEIFADDVKCSHGATSGQLDEEQMFYLQARGIGKERARALLLHAFAVDILKKIHIEPIVEWLDKDIAQRLHDEGN